MTEQFTIENERTLVDNRRGKKYVFSWASDAKEVCYLLNQLNDESELSKRTKECYKSRWKNQLKANGKLIKENEQLKSFKERVFNLLANEIKEENELLDYYLKEKAPCNADRQQIIIGVLKRLQKELEE